MCHASCRAFVERALGEAEVRGRRILEVGAGVVNGSVRPILLRAQPAEYIGTDIRRGPGVDVVVAAEDLLTRFGCDRFDIVISTETLEHIWDWPRAIANIKGVCVPEGIILITTRARGFPPHMWPSDFWRYELTDVQRIFSDCTIMELISDPECPGVFLKARKPIRFAANSLSGIELFNILDQRRCTPGHHPGWLSLRLKALRARFAS